MPKDNDQPTQTNSDQSGWAHTYAKNGVYEKIRPRFSNGDVLQNIEGVLEVISDVLENPIPTPDPSPTHWGGESDADAADLR